MTLFDFAADASEAATLPTFTAPAGPINRWFVRCVDCLSVAAVRENPIGMEWKCAACDGPIENMGRVERDRLVTEHLGCLCNASCTFARGPKCDCGCDGANHGSKMLVTIKRDAGAVPKVNMRDQVSGAYLANEYRTLRAAALEQIEQLRTAGGRGFTASSRIATLEHAVWTARAARVHKTRINKLKAALAAK